MPARFYIQHLLLAMLLFAGSRAAAQHIQLQQMNISGNRTTRQAIILRELSLQAGDSFPADSAAALLALNTLRLNSLALFTEVHLDWDTLGATVWNLNITVKERWYLWPKVEVKLADRNFNVWWQEQHRDLNRIDLSLALTHQNFRGNLEVLTAGIKVGYTQGLMLGYQLPYFNQKQTRGLGCSLVYTRNRELAFATDSNRLLFARSSQLRFLTEQFYASVNYTYRPAYHATHQFFLGYRSLQVADTVTGLQPDFFPGNKQAFRFLEATYRLSLNYTDNWSYPTRGSKLVNYTGWRQGLDGSVQVYVNPEAGLFLRPFPGILTSHIFRGRFSLPQQQPFYWNSAMGYGSEYVRGFEHYVTEGPHFALGRSSIKFQLLDRVFRKLPFRYLPSLPVAIYPKIFADAGYSWQPLAAHASFLTNRLLYSAGMGVDIVTAYDLKLRVEWTRNSLGQWGWFLHLDSE